ncbi:uncharacterized protein METZ01_LOCUS389125 [marine metagenome]|uniref:Uncharacterized protein n=1 Tax=marine metagenome TaxID=408172 RepID=A0A382URG4_9ZZZZ
MTATERTPFHWEMVDGDHPVPMPQSHEEALEMALTLALVCQDFGADDFIEMAEELADDGMDEDTVGGIQDKAKANADAIWAERLTRESAEKWTIWQAGNNPELDYLSGLTQPGVSE